MSAVEKILVAAFHIFIPSPPFLLHEEDGRKFEAEIKNVKIHEERRLSSPPPLDFHHHCRIPRRRRSSQAEPSGGDGTTSAADAQPIHGTAQTRDPPGEGRLPRAAGDQCTVDQHRVSGGRSAVPTPGHSRSADSGGGSQERRHRGLTAN
ncbi:hypothetical protein KSP40_PGU006125 [Platanthera guangdongensis]|uniref:Uncharacterized protein n=1 Tax=Platanthera guangdongensis TaxID=2320717 RepID=A0ABR2MSF1_9ASPA